MNAFTKMLEEGERMQEEPPQFNGGTNKKGQQQMMGTQMSGQSQANVKRTAGVGRTKNRTELRETADAANRLANATKSGEC